MDTKGLIILNIWIFLTVISGIFIWTGGPTLSNYIFSLILFFISLIASLVFGFGMKTERKMDTELLSREFRDFKSNLNELKDVRKKIDELRKEVEDMKKTLEE